MDFDQMPVNKIHEQPVFGYANMEDYQKRT